MPVLASGRAAAVMAASSKSLSGTGMGPSPNARTPTARCPAACHTQHVIAALARLAQPENRPACAVQQL